MGQNQDKLEGEEQALGEGSEETGPSPDSGGAGSHTGDVMEGGSSCEEEAGNTRENSGEPDAQDLDGSPGTEPTTPSSEKHINLRESPFSVREVRQGGAAGKEGGGGGEGGRTAPLVPQETDKNQKSCARIEERAGAHELFNQIKREETEEELHAIKMEYQDEVQHEEIQDGNFSAGVSYEKSGPTASTSEDALENTEEDSVMVKMSRCGAHAGSELLLSVQQDQHDTIMAESEDIKLCAGTVGHLSERKEPPTAQSQHLLKNSLQKESLLDLSDSIHCRPPKERTENDMKEETCELKPVFNDYSSIKPKVTATDDQRESVRPYLQMDTTDNQKIDSCSASNQDVEPSSILERLLKRDRKETTPEVTMDVSAKMILDSSDKIDQSDVNTPLSVCEVKGLKEPKENDAIKDPHIKDVDMKHAADLLTSDCFQPGVTGNTSSLIKPHCPNADCQSAEENINSTVKEDMEIKSPFKNLSTQSAVSHDDRTSCEVSGEESAPLSVSDVKSPPSKSDLQIAESCHLPTADKTDSSPVRPPVQINSDSERKAGPQSPGSADAQSVRRKKVKDSTEDTAVVSKESHQVVKPDLNMTLNTDNMTPDQPHEQPGKEGDDGVKKRDKSQSTPKSRPVSELIKETIQLHEKLQHQEWPKPAAEVKPADEQGHSVKVAQMKAAFDSAQKSPDRSIERKPSVRRGKAKI